jgi:type IV secretory pathway VirB4 component
MMRELLVRYHEGIQVAVIDPEREYEPLCRELGGTFVRLAPGSRQHLNPFDLLPPGLPLATSLADHSRGDRLAEKVQMLHALYDLMLADRGPNGVTPLSTREKGLLDRATYEAYRRRGISSDPATHGHAPPVLRDLYEVLASGAAGKDESGLCERLYRYVEGSLAGTFSAPTDVRLDNRFVVFDVREMDGEWRPIGILLIADFMWTQVLASLRPRVLYIDEAWSLIQHPEGGRFLADLARRARKRYLRLVTITQSPELFVDDPYGAVIAGNAATKLLKKQDRTSAQTVASRFGLTPAERQHLLTLQKPEALLLTGSSRLVITIEANPLEHRLATTDPRELAELAQASLREQPRGLPPPALSHMNMAASNGTPPATGPGTDRKEGKQ